MYNFRARIRIIYIPRPGLRLQVSTVLIYNNIILYSYDNKIKQKRLIRSRNKIVYYVYCTAYEYYIIYCYLPISGENDRERSIRKLSLPPPLGKKIIKNIIIESYFYIYVYRNRIIILCV